MVTIIDDQEIVIKQGELLLLNQNIEHAIKYTNEMTLFLILLLNQSFLNFYQVWQKNKRGFAYFELCIHMIIRVNINF